MTALLSLRLHRYSPSHSVLVAWLTTAHLFPLTSGADCWPTLGRGIPHQRFRPASPANLQARHPVRNPGDKGTKPGRAIGAPPGPNGVRAWLLGTGHDLGRLTVPDT